VRTYASTVTAIRVVVASITRGSITMRP
jgi:hypothetical protein